MSVKAKELKELTTEELAAKLDGAKAELFSLRFQLATNQLENPMRIRDARHSIARIMTLMRERELKVSKA